MKVHLVDGTYELFRSYYGAPAARAPDGREVGGTRGLLRSLLALLRTEEATHVAVAFDHVIESFRNELFDGYKTGEGIEEALAAQFGLAERAAAALGMVVWPMVEFEADDALATAAHRFADDARVDQIVLCSPDKDLAQCVSGDRIVCLDRMRKSVRDEDAVWEKFGVAPESIPDWLALVGDSADGIPGLAGWGAKSAAALLARYRHIEAIPDQETDWEVKVHAAKRLAAGLRANREQAALYRTLAVLRTDVPIAEGVDDVEWHGARRGALESLCDEIGERDLVTRITRWTE